MQTFVVRTVDANMLLKTKNKVYEYKQQHIIISISGIILSVYQTSRLTRIVIMVIIIPSIVAKNAIL